MADRQSPDGRHESDRGSPATLSLRLSRARQQVMATAKRWPIPMTWAVIAVVMTILASTRGIDGSQACPASSVAELPAGDADGSETTDVPATGDALPVLEPASDQPTTVSLGRSRDVRTAYALFNLAPSPVAGGKEGATTDDIDDSDDEQIADVGGDTPAPSATDGVAGAAVADSGGSAGGLLDDEIEPVTLTGVVNPFVRPDGTPLRTDGETPLLSAQVTSHRDVVTVELCVDRDGEAIGHPGTYSGSVSVVDSRVARTDVPFVLQLAYPNPFLLGLVMLVAVAAATTYSWLLHARTDAERRISVEQFRRWLATRTGVLAVASGSVAAYVAFAATYLQNSTWGTTLAQLSAIIGAVFSAFVTAAATILAGSGRDDDAMVDSSGDASRKSTPAPGNGHDPQAASGAAERRRQL